MFHLPYYCLTPTVCSHIFLFTDPPTTEIYTLSLHDALPISRSRRRCAGDSLVRCRRADRHSPRAAPSRSLDRKSTRLNSSHLVISYAVFCLKKKKKNDTTVPGYSNKARIAKRKATASVIRAR